MTGINIVVPCAILLIACGCSLQLSDQSQAMAMDENLGARRSSIRI